MKFNPDWFDNPQKAKARRHIELAVADAIKCGDFEQFVSQLKRKQIKIEITHGSKSQITGVSFLHEGHRFTSSLIGYPWKKLSYTLRYSPEAHKHISLPLAGGSVFDMTSQFMASALSPQAGMSVSYKTLLVVLVVVVAVIVAGIIGYMKLVGY